MVDKYGNDATIMMDGVGGGGGIINDADGRGGDRGIRGRFLRTVLDMVPEWIFK